LHDGVKRNSFGDAGEHIDMTGTTSASAAEQRRRTQAERREEAARRILDAATRIVAEKGLDELTLADAGEAAGYSRGLPAHYFGSKADLLSAIADHIREWFFANLRQRTGRRQGLSNLLTGIDFYFDACRNERAMMLALHTVLAGALHKPLLAEAVAKLNRDSTESIEIAICAGIANGEIRRGVDARAWAVLILSSVRGAIAQWLIDPDHIDLAAARTSLTAAIKRNFAT
jgi:TetR/AcrR family acrAB operon transcriptional repressor